MPVEVTSPVSATVPKPEIAEKIKVVGPEAPERIKTPPPMEIVGGKLPPEYNVIIDDGEYWIVQRRVDSQPIGTFAFHGIIIIVGKLLDKMVFWAFMYPKKEYSRERIEQIALETKGCPYCKYGAEIIPLAPTGEMLKYAPQHMYPEGRKMAKLSITEKGVYSQLIGTAAGWGISILLDRGIGLNAAQWLKGLSGIALTVLPLIPGLFTDFDLFGMGGNEFLFATGLALIVSTATVLHSYGVPQSGSAMQGLADIGANIKGFFTSITSGLPIAVRPMDFDAPIKTQPRIPEADSGYFVIKPSV